MKAVPTRAALRPYTRRVCVTTIRPPQAVVDALERVSVDRRVPRSQAVRDVVQQYLRNPGTQGARDSVRRVYARLGSKLPDRPISVSVPPRLLRSWRSAAADLNARSVAGLVTLAVVATGGCGLTDQ